MLQKIDEDLYFAFHVIFHLTLYSSCIMNMISSFVQSEGVIYIYIVSRIVSLLTQLYPLVLIILSLDVVLLDLC